MSKDLLEEAWAAVRPSMPGVVALNEVYKIVVKGPQGGTWRLDFRNTSGGIVLRGDGDAVVTIIAEQEALLDVLYRRTHWSKVVDKFSFEGPAKQHLYKLRAAFRSGA